VNFLTLKSSKNSTIFVFNKLIIKYPLLKHFKSKNKEAEKWKEKTLQGRRISNLLSFDKELLRALFLKLLLQPSCSFFSEK
jgi:hypothetical protein